MLFSFRIGTVYFENFIISIIFYFYLVNNSAYLALTVLRRSTRTANTGAQLGEGDGGKASRTYVQQWAPTHHEPTVSHPLTNRHVSEYHINRNHDVTAINTGDLLPPFSRHSRPCSLVWHVRTPPFLLFFPFSLPISIFSP